MRDADRPLVIEVAYLWTLEEYLAANEEAWRFAHSRIIRWGLRFLAIVLAGLAALGFSQFPKHDLWLALVFGTAAVALWAGTSYRLFRWKMGRSFLKAGKFAQPDQKLHFVIDEHRIRKLTAGAESSWVWELVPLVVEARSGFLIQHGFGNWLPNHGFASVEDRDEFARLAAARAAKFVSRVRRREHAAFS